MGEQSVRPQIGYQKPLKTRVQCSKPGRKSMGPSPKKKNSFWEATSWDVVFFQTWLEVHIGLLVLQSEDNVTHMWLRGYSYIRKKYTFCKKVSILPSPIFSYRLREEMTSCWVLSCPCVCALVSKQKKHMGFD